MDADEIMERNLAAFLAARPTRAPASAPATVVTAPVVDNRWLSYKEAAREVGKSTRTIRNWIRQGRLDTRVDVMGCTRVRAGSLWQSETRIVRDA